MGLVGAWAACAACAAPTLCQQAARQPNGDPRAAAMVAEAVRQHRAFGGQTLDAHGRLVSAGFQEAEFDRPEGDSVPTWEKVLRFWQAVDAPAGREPRHLRFSVEAPPAERGLLHQAAEQAASARLQGLGVGRDVGLGTEEVRALHASIVPR
jgi:hypothetical protein